MDKTIGATALNLLMFLFPHLCEINHWLCNLPSQTFLKEWVIVESSLYGSVEVYKTPLLVNFHSKIIHNQLEVVFTGVKSGRLYILRRKGSTGESSNTKRPGRPQKTAVMDDHRIISMVKRNPITTM